MKNNSVTLWGKVSDFIPANEIERQQNLVRFYLEVERLSGVIDLLTVHAQKRLIDVLKLQPDDYIRLEGEIRTVDLTVTENDITRNRVLVYVYAENIDLLDGPENIPSDNNIFEGEGNICKLQPVRRTASGRLITDAILSVHRRGAKYDFIPLIFWGSDAVLMDKMDVGTTISIKGRFQSRAYYSTRRERYEIAYEVSVFNLIVKEPEEVESAIDSEETAEQQPA